MDSTDAPAPDAVAAAREEALTWMATTTRNYRKGEAALERVIALARAEGAAEAEKLREYAALLEQGLGAHEARETVWPSSGTEAQP